MSKRDEQRIAKLIKKHTGSPKPSAKDRSAQYDDTLRQKPPEQDEDTKHFFKEMKRREF
jgi:hypothetical protein